MLSVYRIVNIETGERASAVLASTLNRGDVIIWDRGIWQIMGLQ